MTSTDLIREGDHFPLGEPFAEPNRDGYAVMPFGLRYATTPVAAATVELDLSKISYDVERQIATVADGDDRIVPAMRHTSTKTTTETASRDRHGPDKDTDATGK